MSDADGFLDGLSYDSALGREEEADRQASQNRLASALVRRTTMRHDRQCQAKCRHRNHRRDEHHLALLLDILDLADEQPKPDDYDSPLVWHAMSRQEAALLTGKM